MKLLITFVLLTLGLISTGQFALADALKMPVPTTITVASNAIPAERTAAQQLQKYLQQITDRKLSIKNETQFPVSEPQILVGNSARAKVLLPDINWDKLDRDTIVIKTVGNKLVLAGERPRGSIYAVYQFLQDVAGCRWWTPTENTIPHNPQLIIPKLDIVYTPPFYYRQMHVVGFSWEKDPEFQTIFHQDGQHQIQDASWGGHYTMLGFVHTFYKLIPPKKYFSAHPEWFSDPANHDLPCTAQSAMPNSHNSQLCLSAPGLVDEMAKNALVLIDEKPEAGIISISENDNTHYCHCPECVKLYKQEGSWSGPNLQFVNAVAKKIHEKYPDFIVETLAYHGSEKPPKTIRPAKNVMIRLAPLGADFGHPINSDWNKDVRDNLLNWQKIAPQLFIWSYATNFHYYMMPHPNWNSIASNLRFFAANHVKGVFVQGDSNSKGVGDFVQLRAWLTGKLLWNPQLDQDQLMDEFLNGYYGAAGPYLKSYIQLVQESFDSQERKLNSFNDDFSFMTLDVMNEAQKYFDQAILAVQGKKVLLSRVRREKLSLDLCWLKFYRALQKIAKSKDKPFAGPKDPQLALKEFKTTAEAFGIGFAGEGVKFESTLPKLGAIIAPEVALPDFAQNKPAIDVIDLQPATMILSKKATTLVDDPVAQKSNVACLDGESSTWAAFTYLDNFSMMLNKSRWHAYAVVRLQLKPGAAITGNAFSIGAYDRTQGKYMVTKPVTIDSLRDQQYHTIDFGTFIPDGNTALFVATVNNSAVESIYLDRIVLVRVEG